MLPDKSDRWSTLVDRPRRSVKGAASKETNGGNKKKSQGLGYRIDYERERGWFGRAVTLCDGHQYTMHST